MTEHLATLPWTTLLLAAWAVWAVAASVGILVQRRPPVATLAWILALLLLPWIGALVYIAFGPRKIERRVLRYLAATDRVARSTVDHLHATRSVEPFAGPESRVQLAHLVDRAGEGLPVRADRVEVHDDGDDSYRALTAAIEAAQHHVHLEYYIWEPDAVGIALRDLLARRAASGVEVRVLVDAVGSNRLPRRFWAPLAKAGGEVAVFNPLRLSRLRPQLVNFRTHRKLVVCDGATGFVGGMNISRLHSRAHVGAAAWRDTHLRIEGEPVRKLQRIFFEDWMFARPRFRAAAVDNERYFPALHSGAGAWTQVISSGPDEDNDAIHRFYFGAINAGTRRIWMTTPYFIPDEAILTALLTAALRGVDVRLLVPKKGDSRLVTAASRSYFDDLVNGGVRVYEYGPPMLHAKTLLVDDDIAVAGTANVDNRSFRLNFELIAVAYDTALAGTLAAHFVRDLGRASPYRKPSPRRMRRLRTLADRFVDSLARLFSPVL
jgi:cardiolipin synthase